MKPGDWYSVRDLLIWLGSLLRIATTVRSMKPRKVEVIRITRGSDEINVPGYRRRTTWIERRKSSR
jgi:hypothetical protein